MFMLILMLMLILTAACLITWQYKNEYKHKKKNNVCSACACVYACVVLVLSNVITSNNWAFPCAYVVAKTSVIVQLQNSSTLDPVGNISEFERKTIELKYIIDNV